MFVDVPLGSIVPMKCARMSLGCGARTPLVARSFRSDALFLAPLSGVVIFLWTGIMARGMHDVGVLVLLLAVVLTLVDVLYLLLAILARRCAKRPSARLRSASSVGGTD